MLLRAVRAHDISPYLPLSPPISGSCGPCECVVRKRRGSLSVALGPTSDEWSINSHSESDYGYGPSPEDTPQ